MPDNSRVEDLRKRYHENPRRFFAPLANEYRKSGLLDRALQLCEKHVTEQPENMNGLVVYGQTLFELQRHEDARAPFEHALKLDPENLIALRHLGDIARLLGDVPTAKGWYEKVLELDRRNDEVIDLLAEMAGPAAVEEVPAAPPPARPSALAAGLVSVAPTVSISGADDSGMIDLGEPAVSVPSPVEPEPASEPVPLVAEAAPVEAVPPARPSKRASLLDIAFDFSENVEAEPPKAIPQAPVLGAEAAEYGFADTGITVPPTDDALVVETSSVAEPLSLEATSADALMVETTGDVAPLGLEPTAEEPVAAPAAEAPSADFELADFSAQVSPLAGLEATEFSTETVEPMAELEADSVSMTLPSVSPLDGLDRPEVSADDVTPVIGLDTAMIASTESVGEPSVEPPAELVADPAIEAVAEVVSEPPVEQPSARSKPRMTKADLASLPLLADFGLEDEPEPEPVTPSRPSKATPTFVTETMAALYVQQGLLPQAIEVYRQLVEATPADANLRAKLAELERMHAQAATPAPSAADEMPEFEVAMEGAEPEPAPAGAAMSGLSFGEIDLTGQGTATPIVTPAVPSGPTAREFFSTFARRAAVAAMTTAAAATVAAAPEQLEAAEVAEVTAVSETPSASGWPLDALFGAAHEVRDLHAAETLAGLATFTGPDGGTGLASLLSAPAAPKRAVPRASETLKFDQFFQQPGTAAPAAAPEAASAPTDDDLDQFQDWLKGLKP